MSINHRNTISSRRKHLTVRFKKTVKTCYEFFGKNFLRLSKGMIVVIHCRMTSYKKCSQNPLQATTMESFETISNGMLLLTIAAKFSILVVCGAPGYVSLYEPILLISNVADKKKAEIRKNLVIRYPTLFILCKSASMQSSITYL